MLIFYWFYKENVLAGSARRLVCQNVDFLLVLKGKMDSEVDSGVSKCGFSIGFIRKTLHGTAAARSRHGAGTEPARSGDSRETLAPRALKESFTNAPRDSF